MLTSCTPKQRNNYHCLHAELYGEVSFRVTPKKKTSPDFKLTEEKEPPFILLSYYLEENKRYYRFYTSQAVMKYNFSALAYLFNRLFFITTGK